MRVTSRILVLVVVASLAGCSVVGTRPGSPAPTAVGPPASAEASGSAPAPTPVLPSPGARTPSPPPGTWAADSKVAIDELMLAIGNPDTGSKSEAWQAFEAAITGRDPAAIATTAQTVLRHLATARSRLEPYVHDAQNGVVASEWTVMLAGIGAAVTHMRDAATAGSSAEVEAGRTMLGDTLKDHFYQGVYGPSGERWQIHWAWPDARVATPSRSRLGNEAGAPFDGNLESYWTAGDVPAPQWIELDLGRTVGVTGIRLLTAQPVAGSTAHQVTVAGPSLAPRELAAFTGVTSDRQWLEARSVEPLAGVRTVRVTTTSAASLVGWREIELLLAPGSALAPCASAGTNLALGRPVSASTTAAASEPGRAVDGDRSTRWEAAGPAPQSIVIDLGRPASVGSVRMLPIGPADAPIAVVVQGRDEANHTMTLGTINQAATGSDWLTVAGPTPCVGLRWITIDTGWSAGPVGWAEVEVLGTAGG